MRTDDKIFSAAVAPTLWFLCSIAWAAAAFAQTPPRRAAATEDGFLDSLLRAKPEKFARILANPAQYGVQILYTQINRAKSGKITFVSHSYRLDTAEYFYPASTVKFPAAALALEKLNEITRLPRFKGLSRNSALRADSAAPGQRAVWRDSTAKDSLPSVAHYVKKIFLVSDNDAYNRLYEFLGHDYLNERLRAKGFSDCKITRRLSAGTTPEADRTTNPVTLYAPNGSQSYSQRYSQSAATAAQTYAPPLNNLKQGVGFMRRDTLIRQPFDFSALNYVSLGALHEILKTVMFPEAVPPKQRFGLTRSDYDFLYRCMATLPRESDYPRYDASYYDGYVKFFLFGDTKEKIPPNIRIFNKVGNAYGYMIDNAYVADFDNNVEFLLSAVIYANADGVFNDDKYEYDEIALPFLANLGRTVYERELRRKRAVKPDFRRLRALFPAYQKP